MGESDGMGPAGGAVCCAVVDGVNERYMGLLLCVADDDRV